jgi:hypothetical protein
LACHVFSGNRSDRDTRHGTKITRGNEIPVPHQVRKQETIKSADRYGLIPYELLLTGRHPRRSGSRHTCPCQPLPSHYQWQLPMLDIRSRRFRIRYISLCQRLLPISSLHPIYFKWKEKKGFYFDPSPQGGGEKRKCISIFDFESGSSGHEAMRRPKVFDSDLQRLRP